MNDLLDIYTDQANCMCQVYDILKLTLEMNPKIIEILQTQKL